MNLQENIAQRITRLVEYHQETRCLEGSAPPETDPHLQPRPYRIFESCPKIELPTHLIGVDVVATVSLLAHQPEAVAQGDLNPPNDMKTLATWLFMSYGLTQKADGDEHAAAGWLHSCPSSGATYPAEIYVAAFAIEGLEPGLYHFSPREFALRKLRGGDDTFAMLWQGSGGLDVLRASPASLLVSTIFWRSAWKFGGRGYRAALLDAGHVIENISISAAGLGIEALVRLQVNDVTMRQLIGVAPDAPFGEAEAVHAVVVWANPADPRFRFNREAVVLPAPPIPRPPLSSAFVQHDLILQAHDACAARQGSVQEVQPPVTDLSPLPEQFEAYERPPSIEPHGGTGLSSLLMKHRTARAFQRGASIDRDQLLWMNQIAFHGGTYPPLLPQGQHAALVRPFWQVNGVRGLDSGIWFYDAPTDKWASLTRGETRMEATYLALEDSRAGDASAVCYITANLELLMQSAGPHLYRLAHLEAGIAAQRMQMVATALGLGACGLPSFLDEEIRKFLGLSQTHWQAIYAVAIGVPVDADRADAPAEGETKPVEEGNAGESQWRD
jgi:SagB-type dehydrogenase family enzyme